MDIRGELRYRSLYWYNDGLRKAKIRDLTGAENSLKKSIQFDKYNKDARNLLGLVYYGRGDVTRALVVWTVSLKLVPADNIASDYIDEFKSSRGIWKQSIRLRRSTTSACSTADREGKIWLSSS